MISPRAKEVAEKIASRLLGMRCKAEYKAILEPEIQLALTAEALESRNAALREAAKLVSEQPALVESEMNLKFQIVNAILALIKE